MAIVIYSLSRFIQQNSRTESIQCNYKKTNDSLTRFEFSPNCIIYICFI